MRLIKQQRNEIFQAIVNAGYDPGAFRLVEQRREVRIRHPPTGLPFVGVGQMSYVEMSYHLTT